MRQGARLATLVEGDEREARLVQHQHCGRTEAQSEGSYRVLRSLSRGVGVEVNRGVWVLSVCWRRGHSCGVSVEVKEESWRSSLGC